MIFLEIYLTFRRYRVVPRLLHTFHALRFHCESTPGLGREEHANDVALLPGGAKGTRGGTCKDESFYIHNRYSYTYVRRSPTYCVYTLKLHKHASEIISNVRILTIFYKYVTSYDIYNSYVYIFMSIAIRRILDLRSRWAMDSPYFQGPSSLNSSSWQESLKSNGFKV